MKTKQILATLPPVLFFITLFIFTTSRPAPVHAMGFVVNGDFDDADAHDATPGDGICADTFNACTLRAAIEEANALAGEDTITFANAMTITIDTVATGALPALNGDVIIDASNQWNNTDNVPGVVLMDGVHTMSGVYALRLAGDSNQIYGLYITGFTRGGGISISSATNSVGGTGAGQRNVISGNTIGVEITGMLALTNTIQSNYIGLAPSGDSQQENAQNGVQITFGATENSIGGDTAAKGNYISGNGTNGVEIYDAGESNYIHFNKIGVAADDTTAMGNGGYGVSVTISNYTDIGGADAHPNEIAYNTAGGISIVASHSSNIQKNRIHNNGLVGASIVDGIAILEGADNYISANVIHNNTGNGIFISNVAAVRNEISSNTIYANSLKGIKLFDGGNTELAAPIISSATTTMIVGTTCPNCTIQLFSGTDNEGRTFEGDTIADASGNWIIITLSRFVGPNITATVTDSNYNTSEFSLPFTIEYTVFLPVIMR